MSEALSEVGELSSGKRGPALAKRALERAAQARETSHAEWAQTFLQFDALEKAVVWRMLERGEQFRPYDSASMQFYKAQTGKTVNSATVQKKLESLRSRTPPFLWKSSRGEYAPYDQAMQVWFTFEVNRGTWPPAPSAPK